MTSEIARTKTNAILRVGKALRYAVVAEFVEERDVLTRLKALVPYVQGFGIYQPHPWSPSPGFSPPQRWFLNA